MIRLHVPGFFDSDKGGPRWGDATILDDGKYFLVIDGYCGVGTTHLIDALKKRNIKSPYLFITHPHYDHYYGIREIIRNKYFTPKGLIVPYLSSYGDVSGEVRSNKQALQGIINEAKAKGIKIKYVKNGDKCKYGDIEFTVYQNTSGKYDGNSEGYVNDRSLSFWFQNLKYLTTGDGATKVNDIAMPRFLKIGHHGNWCIRVMARWLKDHGCIYCWDNDYSTYITDFLETGREDCIGVGMKYFSCHGDLNVVFFGGTAVIYKDLKKWTYKCAYRGKTALKGADEPTVRKTLRGTYGSNNTRITNLLNAGYYPLAVQNKVNDVVRIAKGILNGTLDYGKNEARIAKIDKELGKGYGQLVQDYINVLCGVREKV